jgi:drug/metabolite transporter (DMT)-like permease
MERRSLIAAVAVLAGGAALAYWTTQAGDPSTPTTVMGIVLAVGMAGALAAAAWADGKHFRVGPHQAWFVVIFVALLAGASAAFAADSVPLGIATLLALATTIVLFVRTRRQSSDKRPHAAS